MNLIPEVYAATDDKYDYRISRIKDEGWVVIRWPLGEVKIPPRAEILTGDGWKGLLNNALAGRYLTSIEVSMIATGAFVLPG